MSILCKRGSFRELPETQPKVSLLPVHVWVGSSSSISNKCTWGRLPRAAGAIPRVFGLGEAVLGHQQCRSSIIQEQALLSPKVVILSLLSEVTVIRYLSAGKEVLIKTTQQ